MHSMGEKDSFFENFKCVTWHLQLHLVFHVEVGSEDGQACHHACVRDVEEDFSSDAIDAQVGGDRGHDVDDAQDDGRHVRLNRRPGSFENRNLQSGREIRVATSWCWVRFQLLCHSSFQGDIRVSKLIE